MVEIVRALLYEGDTAVPASTCVCPLGTWFDSLILLRKRGFEAAVEEI